MCKREQVCERESVCLSERESACVRERKRVRCERGKPEIREKGGFFSPKNLIRADTSLPLAAP